MNNNNITRSLKSCYCWLLRESSRKPVRKHKNKQKTLALQYKRDGYSIHFSYSFLHWLRPATVRNISRAVWWTSRKPNRHKQPLSQTIQFDTILANLVLSCSSCPGFSIAELLKACFHLSSPSQVSPLRDATFKVPCNSNTTPLGYCHIQSSLILPLVSKLYFLVYDTHAEQLLRVHFVNQIVACTLLPDVGGKGTWRSEKQWHESVVKSEIRGNSTNAVDIWTRAFFGQWKHAVLLSLFVLERTELSHPVYNTG